MPEIPARLLAALADRYRIERELGQGGMAAVYLAEDLRHDRKVAVKVLRPELAAVLGAERFLREIKTTAALQHPHILPLFDSGEADGFLYYVMPYIDGETLREKLDRETQLGIDEAVRITTDIAEALDYAHRHHVIHRDIKPENILLHDGRPMVADFGIALAVTAAAGGRMTETGLSLGTPHYMSPEQATADKDITARSDVYSLGSVLYEMLTGDPPHTGSSAQQIIMKIVTEEAASVAALRKSVPPNVAAALRKALEKLPADRFATAQAFGAALTNATFAWEPMGQRTAAVQSGTSRGPYGWIGAILLFAVIAIVGWMRPMSDVNVVRQRIVLAADPPDPGSDIGRASAIAPDGSAIVYAAGGFLWIKERDAVRPVRIEGSAGAARPSFSPDGESILFGRGTTLYRIARSGGPATEVAAPISAEYGAAAWLEDGRVLYTTVDFDLAMVPAAGGESPVLVAEATDFAAESRAVLALTPLPKVRGVLAIACTVLCQQAELYLIDLEGRAPQLLYEDVAGAWYAPTGHLVFVRRDGAVFSVPFDLRSRTPRGNPVPVMAGVLVDGTNLASFELSASGDLLYVTGGARGEGQDEFVWVTRDGIATPVDSTWVVERDPLGGFALSPDGSRIAVTLQRDGRSEIWIRHLADGLMVRVAFDGVANARPAWSADGEYITFVRDSDGDGGYDVYERRADARGLEKLLVDVPEPVFQGLRGPNGSGVIYRPLVEESRRDIRLRTAEGEDRVIVNDGPSSMSPAISPNGEWLAYVSNETGRHEVYIRSLVESDDRRWPVSRDGATAPKWSRDGSRLFFRGASGHLAVVDLTFAPDLRVSSTRTLFDTRGYTRPNADIPYYEIGLDDRFLFLRPLPAAAGGVTGRELVYVQNWAEELKPKVRN